MLLLLIVRYNPLPQQESKILKSRHHALNLLNLYGAHV